MRSERRLRVPEFAELVGYKPSTIRKKILRREIAYHKIGRIIAIPESEAEKLLRDFRPSIHSCQAKEEAD